jgi:hypothetical protein
MRPSNMKRFPTPDLINSVHISNKTQHVSIAKINWLTMFKEMITVILRINILTISVQCTEMLNVNVGGTQNIINTL